MARLTGVVTNRPRIPDRRQHRPYEQGSRALFYLRSAESVSAGITGEVTLALGLGITTGSRIDAGGRSSLALQFRAQTNWRYQQPTTKQLPDVVYEVAFDSGPLEDTPAWEALSSRVRGFSATRGRSYEFDRFEAGQLTSTLSNRDAALSPANSQSTYAPIKSTRPVRAFLDWDTSYPLFRGISEGYPQAFRDYGLDAIVELRANDLFYALNNARFVPGSTALAAALAVVAEDTSETVTVSSTLLPMPQTVPFTITVDSETMTVTAIASATQYTVSRTLDGTATHTLGTTVSTTAVSFGEELSGTRIQNVLERVGFDSDWYDLDAGQSLIAASEDLASTNPLEHISLVSECEFGRFFVSREGKFTFRDRHSVYLDHLIPVMTFADLTLATGDDVPYVLEGPLTHSEEKLFNHARIILPSEEVIEDEDASSIADHFRRTFERQWPYASRNTAEAAVRYVLGRSKDDTLRLPGISVSGIRDPQTLWPLLLAREIGDRCRFRYQPEGGGDEIDEEVVIDGIAHAAGVDNHVITFQCTQVSSTEYWILGKAGYSEVGTTTRVAF